MTRDCAIMDQMKKSHNNETDGAKSGSVEPATGSEGGYYYDDATGYEVFTDDEDDEKGPERSQTNLPA